MKRLARRATPALLIALILGCSRSPKTFPTDPPPHGGVLLTLPGGRGFAEVLLDQPPAQSSRDAGRNSVIVAYFLQADKKTPLEPPPTGVRVAVDPGGGQQVPLSPRPHPEDPSKAGQFASAVGPYGESGALSGELRADLDGEAVALPFSIR
ncbi:MAG TPA: hypothetical protein VG406_08475 [Isosphaeraceae bacterium]|jgi:hypothetical protein|nr:hypothetical protein [Isosphaeraceae bacterium]